MSAFAQLADPDCACCNPGKNPGACVSNCLTATQPFTISSNKTDLYTNGEYATLTITYASGLAHSADAATLSVSRISGPTGTANQIEQVATSAYVSGVVYCKCVNCPTQTCTNPYTTLTYKLTATEVGGWCPANTPDYGVYRVTLSNVTEAGTTVNSVGTPSYVDIKVHKDVCKVSCYEPYTYTVDYAAGQFSVSTPHRGCDQLNFTYLAVNGWTSTSNCLAASTESDYNYGTAITMAGDNTFGASTVYLTGTTPLSTYIHKLKFVNSVYINGTLHYNNDTFTINGHSYKLIVNKIACSTYLQ